MLPSPWGEKKLHPMDLLAYIENNSLEFWKFEEEEGSDK
jgi:hypothetical protein